MITVPRALPGIALAVLWGGVGLPVPTVPAAETAVEHALRHADPSYVCPMHPNVVRGEPGECPLCGMSLVRVESAPPAAAPAATGAGTPPAREWPVVTVREGLVGRLGVRTARVTRADLARPIATVGYVTGAVYSAGVGLPQAPVSARTPGAGPPAGGATAGEGASEPRVTVSGEVFERDVPLLAEGVRAELRVRYLPGRVWTGTVDWIDQDVDPLKRTLLFHFSVADPEALLRSNMRGDVTLLVDARAGVLSVSREAVIRTGHGDRVVLALGDGRFQPRAVVVGLEGGERVEVLSGLAEGDVVVASAQFLLDSEANLRAGLQRLAGGEEEAAESAR